jgi:hypothetical protein
MEWVMAWKKDLEKLKQSLGPEDLTPRKSAPPPKPKPLGFKPIEEEDAVFLSAMGHRPRPAGPQASAPAATPRPEPPPPPPEAPGAEFASAMGDLKGLVAIRPALPAPPPPPVLAAPPAPEPPAPPPAPEAPPPQPAPEAAPLLPVQINLAAGMAIDVDGALDLKGHGRMDAEERLKERILDSHFLGWRTLHVVLGPSEELRQMLLDLLKSPSGLHLSRYAQAPIPMGGSQAWILYFRNPLPPPEAN